MLNYASVSVVIPCYCCTLTLARAVNSVYSQLILPREVILVDDASPDSGKTRSLIEDLVLSFSRYQIAICPIFLSFNQGPGGARNAGWEVATQQFIAFLDSDDTWHPSKLLFQYKFMITNPDCTASCHNTYFFSGNTTAPQLFSSSCNYQKISLEFLLFKNLISTRSVMIKRKIKHRFPCHMHYAEDFFLWLKVLADNDIIIKFNLPLAIAYKPDSGSDGLSGNLVNMHKGVVFCLKDLLHRKTIDRPLFYASLSFEYLKFILRVLRKYLKAPLRELP